MKPLIRPRVTAFSDILDQITLFQPRSHWAILFTIVRALEPLNGDLP